MMSLTQSLTEDVGQDERRGEDCESGEAHNNPPLQGDVNHCSCGCLLLRGTVYPYSGQAGQTPGRASCAVFLLLPTIVTWRSAWGSTQESTNGQDHPRNNKIDTTQ